MKKISLFAVCLPAAFLLSADVIEARAKPIFLLQVVQNRNTSNWKLK
ncbi:MAG: hypothetical protein H0V31_10670 [Acidobacteria bacterium]|nr:hypothetical protein [Acidobacteriota bacterium]